MTLASFIVDSRLEEHGFESFMPEDFHDGVHLEIELFDTEASSRSRGDGAITDDGAVHVELRSPAGTLLGGATVVGISRGHAETRFRQTALAWSIVVLLMLVVVLFGWNRLVTTNRGLALAAGAVSLGRIALLLARVPAILLPRELGSASVFGTSGLIGLAGSPADLLLSSITVAVLCVIVRDFAARLQPRRPTLSAIVAAAGAAAALTTVAWMLVSVARNSSVPLLAPSGIWKWGVRSVLASAIVLTMIGAAELLALLWSMLRRQRLVDERRGSRISVGVVLSIVLLLGSLGLQQMSQRLALERLRTEFEPLVLEQNALLQRLQVLAGLLQPQRRAGQSFRIRAALTRRDDRGAGRRAGRDPHLGRDLRTGRIGPAQAAARGAVGHRGREASGYGRGSRGGRAGQPAVSPQHTTLSRRARAGRTPRVGRSAVRQSTVRTLRVRRDGPALNFEPAAGHGRRARSGLRQTGIGRDRSGRGSLSLLVLISAIPKIARGRTLFDLARSVRGSFYRKLLAALLLASMVPLVGLALFLRGYIDQRGREALETAATQYAGAAQRVLDDYAATLLETEIDYVTLLNDDIVDWLRTVVGQEILVYENGLLQATSKRELFSSGLLLARLDGEVHQRLGREGLPYLVVQSRLGPTSIPVAYAPVQGADPLRELVVAVPMIAQQQEIARATDRVGEMILLSTVLIGALLAVVAAIVARTVARPVRELVGATGRIAAGDYGARLEARTRDEVAELVSGFNSMASSLAAQRADLERRRDYMERLLQHATTGVVSVDPEGRVVTLNPAARALLFTNQGRPTIGEELVSSLSRSAELEPLAALLSAPLKHPGEPDEVDLVREGEPRRLRVVRIDLPDPAGGSVGRLVLLDDVTELMRSNQLAAWAEMARAIAHEIKNPLTPIQLSTEHLKRLLRDRKVLPEPNLDACLDTVIKQVRTLYDIAGEFSAYAKLPSLKPEPTDAVAFMRAAVGPYRAASPQGVAVEERYEPAGRVAVDGKVLGRAVVNLVENALQAMQDGGTLTFAVRPDEEHNEVVLSVADTGVGLSPEVRRRLFEPYFSTKSSGTGLGLAIARRAVEAHQGRIEVDSGPDRGTVFRVHLPRVA
jgi:signal transduction histidine kinase